VSHRCGVRLRVSALTHVESDDKALAGRSAMARRAHWIVDLDAGVERLLGSGLTNAGG